MGSKMTAENITIKGLSNETIRRYVSAYVMPRIHCQERIDIEGLPRHINVEFCGWQVGLLVNEEQTLDFICKHISDAFNNSCNPPTLFKRIKKLLRLK